MTTDDFVALERDLGLSRREFGHRLGISPNTATKYAHGRRIPQTVALACAALVADLEPYPAVTADRQRRDQRG